MELRPGWNICDYCNRDDVVLYAWHADPWCAACIADDKHLVMIGSLEDAPLGRPENPGYERPFILQTPDGGVVDGVVQPGDTPV